MNIINQSSCIVTITVGIMPADWGMEDFLLAVSTLRYMGASARQIEKAFTHFIG